MFELIACSGPGAGEAIATSILVGYAHAAVLFVLVLFSLWKLSFDTNRWGASAILLILLALHPAWTVSAISGDCGYTKRDASWVFSGIGFAVLFWQIVRNVSPTRTSSIQNRQE